MIANLLLAQAATFKMLRCAFAAANVYMEAKISRKIQMLLCRRLRWERFVCSFFFSRLLLAVVLFSCRYRANETVVALTVIVVTRLLSSFWCARRNWIVVCVIRFRFVSQCAFVWALAEHGGTYARYWANTRMCIYIEFTMSSLSNKKFRLDI